MTNRLFDLDELRQLVRILVKTWNANLFVILVKLLEEVLHLASAIHDGSDGEQFARREDRADCGPFHFRTDIRKPTERQTVTETNDLGRLFRHVQIREHPVV